MTSLVRRLGSVSGQRAAARRVISRVAGDSTAPRRLMTAIVSYSGSAKPSVRSLSGKARLRVTAREAMV